AGGVGRGGAAARWGGAGAVGGVQHRRCPAGAAAGRSTGARDVLVVRVREPGPVGDCAAAVDLAADGRDARVPDARQVAQDPRLRPAPAPDRAGPARDGGRRCGVAVLRSVGRLATLLPILLLAAGGGCREARVAPQSANAPGRARLARADLLACLGAP